MTDSTAPIPAPTRVRERVKLDRDESRDGRHRARWVLRGLLSAAIAVAVLATGGASWTAIAAIWVLLAAALPAALIAVPNKPPRILLGLLWLGLGGFVALQLLPLPRFLVEVLQPKAVELSDLGRAALGMPQASFIAIALAPGDAALQGAVYLLGAALALLGSIALSGHDGRRAIHWTSNVVLGLAVTSAFAWVCAYTSPLTDFVPAGLSKKLELLCFVNANQEAAVLNLGIAMGLSRMRLAVNPRWQTVFGTLALLLAFAVLEVGSRGGLITMCLVLTMTMFMRPRPVKGRRIDQRELQRAALVRTSVLIASVALVAAVVALPAIEAEFSSTNDSHKATIMARMVGLADGHYNASPLLRQSWRAGAGPGGLPVLAGLDESWGNKRIDFAENIVLDSVFSFGVLGALLFCLGLAWALIDHVRRRADVPQAPGFIVASTSMVVANFADFSLQLSGGLLPFLALATACERALGPRGGRDNLEEKRKPTFRRVLVAALVALLVAGVMIGKAHQAMNRDIDSALSGLSADAMRDRIGARFLSEHHAFYLYGRKLTEAKDFKGAAKAFDRAVALRPGSAHARLFRFAAHLELGETKVAADDLRWLLDREDDIVERAMRLCMQSRAAEAVLVNVIPRGLDQSGRIAPFLITKHPELVERVALTLRENHPKRVFAIELARGELYLQRGKLEAARRIAANLLANKETRTLGYQLEAELLQAASKFYEAFHLFREVCKEKPNAWGPCSSAVSMAVLANRPDEALAYLNSRAPYMLSVTWQASFFWYSKGQIAAQMNRQEDALEAFRRAHGFAPDSAEATGALATTCVALGLRDEARVLVDELLAKVPKSPVGLALSKELDRDAHHAVDTMPSVTPTPSILDP